MPPRPPPVLPAAPGPRKPRRRWLVFVPFTIAVLLGLAAAVAWVVIRGRLAAGLDEAERQARADGLELTATARRIGGFPLRLRVSYDRVRLAGGTGWAVEARGLVAQAYVYAPLHWVLVAPQGLTITRPQGGALVVAGRALRASVTGVGHAPWRVTLAGEEVDFSTPTGARPFPLAGVGRIGLYVKPAPDGAPGDGAVLLDVAGARATPGSLAWNLAPDAPFDAAVEGRLTHLAALRGADWGAALRGWRDAGGALVLGRAEALGGPTELWAQGGAVGVDAEGRLAGAVPLRLRQAPQLFSGPAGAQTVSVRKLDPASREPASSRFDLLLKNGEVRLGPVRVGPSPRVV